MKIPLICCLKQHLLPIHNRRKEATVKSEKDCTFLVTSFDIITTPALDDF